MFGWVDFKEDEKKKKKKGRRENGKENILCKYLVEGRGEKN